METTEDLPRSNNRSFMVAMAVAVRHNLRNFLGERLRFRLQVLFLIEGAGSGSITSQTKPHPLDEASAKRAKSHGGLEMESAGTSPRSIRPNVTSCSMRF